MLASIKLKSGKVIDGLDLRKSNNVIGLSELLVSCSQKSEEKYKEALTLDELKEIFYLAYKMR